MAAISAELNAINARLRARDELDAGRRKIDDERDGEGKERDKAARALAKEVLDRTDGHGGRLKTLEINWATFFGETGAFTYFKKKIEATETQNRWIIGLIITTLIGVIVNLSVKH
jgi:hypothetical protein